MEEGIVTKEEETVPLQEEEEEEEEEDNGVVVVAAASDSTRPMPDFERGMIKALNRDIQIMTEYNKKLKDLENRRKQLVQRGLMLEEKVLNQTDSDLKPKEESAVKQRGSCYSFFWFVLLVIVVACCIWAPPLAIFGVFIGLFVFSIYLCWSLFLYLCCCFGSRKKSDQRVWNSVGNFWIYTWMGIALFLFTVYNYLTTVESWKQFEEMWMLEKTLNQK